MDDLTADEVATRLQARARAARTVRGEVPAAVLIPLLRRGGDVTRVLLTRRHAGLRHHAGQYAFPGGRTDPDDRDAVHTALREGHEEVGITPDAVRVLGLLDDHLTSTGFVVTPVVAWIPGDLTYRPSPSEVAEVVELPLTAFRGPVRAQTLAGAGLRRIVLPFDVEGHRVWGATAAMLRELVARLDGAR
ncbi:MAG: CoA pyrophosphatase [Polyangiales bacterium]